MNKKQATQKISKTQQKQTKNKTQVIKKFNINSQDQILSNNPQRFYGFDKTHKSTNNNALCFTHFISNQGLTQTYSKSKGEIQESLVTQIYCAPHLNSEVRLVDDDENDFRDLLLALSAVKVPERSQVSNEKIKIMFQDQKNGSKQNQNSKQQKLVQTSKKQAANINKLKGSLFNLSHNEIKWFMIGTFVMERLEHLTRQQVSWVVESLKKNRRIPSENRKTILTFIQQIIKEIENLEMIPLKLKNFYYSMAAYRLYDSMKKYDDQNILKEVIEYGRQHNTHFTQSKRKMVCSVAQVYLQQDYVHKQAKAILIRNLDIILSLYMDFQTKKAQSTKCTKKVDAKRSRKVQENIDKNASEVEFKEKKIFQQNTILNPFFASEKWKDENNKLQDFPKLVISSFHSPSNIKEISKTSMKKVSKQQKSDYSSDSDSNSDSETDSDYQTFLRNQADLNASFLEKKRLLNISKIVEHKKQSQQKNEVQLFSNKARVDKKVQCPQILIKSSVITRNSARNSQLQIQYQELGKLIKLRLTEQFCSFLKQVFRDYSDTKTIKDSYNFNVKTRRSVLDFIGDISQRVKQIHQSEKNTKGQILNKKGNANLGKQVSHYFNQSSISRILQIRQNHSANYFPIPARKQIYGYIQEVMSLSQKNI